MVLSQSFSYHRFQLWNQVLCSHNNFQNGNKIELIWKHEGTSLVVQWLRLWTPNAGDLGLIARSQVPQLRVRMPLLKILDAAVKDPTGLNKDRKFHVLQLRLSAAKINKYLKKEKERTTCDKAKYCFVKLLCCARVNMWNAFLLLGAKVKRVWKSLIYIKEYFPSASIYEASTIWQPTPIFLPGKSQGQRSLAGYSPWVGHQE